MCREKFPEIVEKAFVWKWARTCNAECWEDLPLQVASTIVQTPNSWRRKNGCKTKGRAPGGSVPKEIQRELDHLVLEMSQGLFLNFQSERKLSPQTKLPLGCTVCVKFKNTIELISMPNLMPSLVPCACPG